MRRLIVVARVRGLSPTGTATVKAVEWFGEQCVQVLYLDKQGVAQQAVPYRDGEARLSADEKTAPWSFDADGDLLRLSEAYRIHLAWLFDPYVAITTSTIEPLPHQIWAVYEEMLPRQPMRFLLADDPGAGKTIMAGLLIKELLIRGDLQCCLIVSPGSLTEQWQDELHEKFHLDFDLLTRDMIEASRTAHPFEQKNLLIVRLDQISRNEDIQEKLKSAPEWDLAYRLYSTCERKGWADDARAYNGLVIAWPELEKLAAAAPAVSAEKGQLGRVLGSANERATTKKPTRSRTAKP